jgi:hypothetical protein
MNLSVLLPIAFVIVLYFFRVKGSAAVPRLASVIVALLSLGVGTAVVYYALFADFSLVTAELVGNVLDFFEKSMWGFVAFYCICFPVLVGFLLFVIISSVRRIVIRNSAPAK